MATYIASNSAQTNKIFGAALFTESTRRNSLVNLLTEAAPQELNKNKADSSVQTKAGAPVVRVTDLSKKAGDEVTMDLIHQLRQKPRMGDKKLAGYGASLKFAEFTLKINQGRTMVDSGGKMTQKRTPHSLKKLAKGLLSPYFNRLQDQIAVAHLAGARGSHFDSDWILPLEDDEDFADIMVNPLTPPTYDRHMYGGDASSLDSLDSADIFSLDCVDNVRLHLDEMANPLQPVRFEKDQQNEEAPFFVMLISPRQWHDFWTSTSGADWRTLTAAVQSRANAFNSPIFKGDCAMWHNILIRKVNRPIRFNSGDVVNVSTNTANAGTTQVAPGVRVDRSVVLGAQALASAYGSTGDKGGGYHFSMHSESTDHENSWEHSIAWMNGLAKTRFKGTDGRVNDHGCLVVDTAISG